MAKVRNVLFIMCDQLRWDYLSCSGPPASEDAEHRPPREHGRSLRPRLRQRAGVRPLADELLHGPHRVLARRDLELRAAADRRVHDRRLSDAAGRARRRRRQDAHHAGRRRSRAPGPDAAHRHRSDRLGRQHRAVGARRRHPSAEGRQARPRLQSVAQRSSATTATTPGTPGPTRARGRTARSCRAGRCATRSIPRASRRSTPRRPTSPIAASSS